MKGLAIAALLAAQTAGGATSAFAADLWAGQEIQAGAFGGLRVRIPFGGNREDRRVRAGLAVAPTLQGRFGDGSVRARIGEGLEFGYRSGRPLSFSLAGQDLGRGRPGAAAGGGNHTARNILIVVGGVILVSAATVTVLFLEWRNNDE